jgi:hypothetical protein
MSVLYNFDIKPIFFTSSRNCIVRAVSNECLEIFKARTGPCAEA